MSRSAVQPAKAAESMSTNGAHSVRSEPQSMKAARQRCTRDRAPRTPGGSPHSPRTTRKCGHRPFPISRRGMASR
eukprot:scaffold294451_cov28-Tisochrysis_lutea.AAC.1